MSQQKSSNSLASSILKIAVDFCSWVCNKFLPKVGKILWEKSFLLSGFILEIAEDQMGTPIHPLKRRAFKNIFSFIIFLIIIGLLVLLVNIFFSK